MIQMKTALITGATSGIGAACAHLFAAQGYNLILVARREQLLTAHAKHLEDKYAISVKKIVADVRDFENLSYHLETLPAQWKKVNVKLLYLAKFLNHFLLEHLVIALILRE